MEKDQIIKTLVRINGGVLELWLAKEKVITKETPDMGVLTAYQRLERELQEGFNQILELCKAKNLYMDNIETYAEHVANQLPVGKLQGEVGTPDKIFALAQYILRNIDYTDNQYLKGYPVYLRDRGTIHISMGIVMYIRQISYDVIHNMWIANNGREGKEIQTHAVETLLTYIKILITLGISSRDIKW